MQQGIKVLTFPEKSLPEFPELDLKVPCIFCEKEFPNTSGKNDAVLHHMLIEHQLVIGDVGQVCDLRRYENMSFQEGTFFEADYFSSRAWLDQTEREAAWGALSLSLLGHVDLRRLKSSGAF